MSNSPEIRTPRPDESESDDRYSLLLKLLGLVVALWLIFGAIVWFKRAEVGTTGPFGDTFGVLNTLFSGMAFAAFIYTVSLQRKELRLQRQELRDTREELRAQRQQMEQQNVTSSQQRFESTFFRMVDLHHSIVAAIHMPSAFKKSEEMRGRAALADLGEFFRRAMINNELGPTRETRLKGAVDFYLANYHDRQHALAHYFRNLYRIVKLVNESEMPNKAVYAGIVRAQLSNSELILLFFNCLSPLGREKFKPLAERYALFEHIPVDEDFLNKFRVEYAPSAFGDNQPANDWP